MESIETWWNDNRALYPCSVFLASLTKEAKSMEPLYERVTHMDKGTQEMSMSSKYRVKCGLPHIPTNRRIRALPA